MKILNRKCPVCGNEFGSEIKKIQMHLPPNVPLPSAYSVVYCEKCGFTFADTTADQEDYNNYYENYNMYSSNGDIKKEQTENLSKLRFTLISKYIEKGKKILDIGCGSGDLLQYLKRNNYSDLFGIDPSIESINALSKKGIKGSVGNIFFDIPIELKGSFDVVICTAVIEHLYNLHDVIPKLTEFLKKSGGLLFIDAPAVEGFEKYITKVPNYFNHEHINYFSIKSLDNLLAQSKYRRVNTLEECYGVIESIAPELGLQGLYQYDENIGVNMEYDDLAEKSIRNYFVKADEESEKNYDNIRSIIEKYEKIIIWGTGSYTMQLLANMPELAKFIAFFIDNNETKIGMTLCEKTVYSPQHLLSVDDEFPILICSMQNEKDIRRQITDMKINNNIISF